MNLKYESQVTPAANIKKQKNKVLRRLYQQQERRFVAAVVKFIIIK